jgi:HSP20 family protein
MTTETMVKNPSESPVAERTRNGMEFRPNVDIQELENELLVIADVPGARGDSIDLNFEDGTLTIHAEVPPRQSEDLTYLRQEYEIGDYYRTFQVSEAVDASKISAQYADGVLTLHLPKTEAVRPRKIQVNLA